MESGQLSIETDLLDTGDGRLQGRMVVAGDVDAATSAQVDSSLDHLLAAGATDLIVDTTDVTFLDSSGLRSLIRARQQFGERGGTFVIDGMSPAVLRILELAGLLELGATQTVGHGERDGTGASVVAEHPGTEPEPREDDPDADERTPVLGRP